MRKVFSLVFVATATLAIVVGVAVAWTSSATQSYTTPAGSLAVAIADDHYTGNKVYPTGTDIFVLYGRIQNNTPADPGIAVQIIGGSVDVTNAGVPTCDSFRVAGGITGNLSVQDSSFVSPGGNVGGQWYANLHMNTDAPNACQGQTISYDVIVNAGT